MTGEHFAQIPNNAVGLYAVSNDDPLASRYGDVDWYFYDIVENTGTSMRLVSRNAFGHAVANYLGGIVSADRQIVYWVNNSRPLP